MAKDIQMKFYKVKDKIFLYIILKEASFLALSKEKKVILQKCTKFEIFFKFLTKFVNCIDGILKKNI